MCKCGGEGTVFHYATACEYTKDFHFGSTTPQNYTTWKKQLLRKHSRIERIKRLIRYVISNEDKLTVTKQCQSTNVSAPSQADNNPSSDSDYDPLA